MKKLDVILKAVSKILELEALIETEIGKVGNAKKRNQLKKLCEKARKDKDDSSLADLREHLFKL